MHCKDTWIRHIPSEKLAAYKQMIDDGLIFNQHITYVRSEKTTIVEYDANHTHEYILAQLKKRSLSQVTVK